MSRTTAGKEGTFLSPTSFGSRSRSVLTFQRTCDGERSKGAGFKEARVGILATVEGEARVQGIDDRRDDGINDEMTVLTFDIASA